MRAAHAAIQAQDNVPLIAEQDGSPRLVFGIHLLHPHFREMTRHPKLLVPAQQLLAGGVYVHQSKFVLKTPQAGDGVPWHQDYGFWKSRDRIPTSSMLSAIVFLDRVSEINAPIMILAGSQREGLVKEETYVLDRRVIQELGERYPIEVPEGPAGSVLFLHSLVVHGSATNISPFDRTLAFVTYNRVDNAPPDFADAPPPYVSGREREELTPSEERGA